METEIHQIEDWTVRIHQPPGPGPYPLVLMLHGWTGDEDVMWVFADRLPARAMLIAPRGLHLTPLGGWGWHPHKGQGWAVVDDFRPAVQALCDLLQPHIFPQIDFTQMSLIGFSQGAALSYTLALLHPERVQAVAGLAGFLPEGAEVLAEGRPLQGKRVFAAHGTQDQMVPVERARQAVAILESAGAEVDYCEAKVGHKLSASCSRGLKAFFAQAVKTGQKGSA